MDKSDIEKIEKIIQDRKYSREKLVGNNSKVFKKFIDLDNETYKDRSLKSLHKELIALGISIVINCESCMQHHLEKALIAGAIESQIIETIEVAIEMGGGPATVSSRFALKVLDYYKDKNINKA
ncbi:MAG: carboxymuconolactone decarboxylase family protein [Promethearchaeota archaeon]